MNINVYIASNNTYFSLGIEHFFSGKTRKGREFSFIKISNINDYFINYTNESGLGVGILIADVDFLNLLCCDGRRKFFYWILPLEFSRDNFITFKDKTTSYNHDELSCREAQVFSLIALGMNDSTISSFLGVSIKTIYSHRRNIMLKLKTNNRTNLWKIINTIK